MGQQFRIKSGHMAAPTSSTIVLLILSMQLVPADSVPAIIEGVTAVPAVAVGQPALRITWSVRNGDGTITGYEIENRVTGTGTTGLVATATQTVYTILSLQPGTMYDIRVRAVATEGEGAWSAWISGTTFNGHSIPDEPAITSRQYYDTSIKLTWTRSGADDFIIYYKNAQTDSTEYITMDSTEPTTTITGLESNTHYKMIIGARNRFGSTNNSAVDTYTLAEAPGSTRAWALSPSSIQVTWTPPMNIEPRPSRLYVDYLVAYAGISPYTTGNTYAGTDVASVTLTYRGGLHPYIKYTISVQAYSYNSGQRSAASNSTTVWTYSDKPTMPPGERSNHIMSRWCSLTWKSPPPTGRNGIITTYLLQIEYPDGAIRKKTVVLSNPTFTHPEETTYNLTNLTPYTIYKWRVAAATVNGTGPFSTSPIAFSTLEDVPGPISNLSFTASSNTTAKVSWVLPAAPNGVVTQYTVECKEVTMGSNMAVKNITRLIMTTTTTLNDLRAYIPYNVTVTAHTSVGAGEPTSIILGLFTVKGGYFKTAKVDSGDDSSLAAIGAGVAVGTLAMVAILVAVIIIAICVAKRRKRQADMKQDNCKKEEGIYDEVYDTVAVSNPGDDIIKMKKSEAYGETYFFMKQHENI